MTHTPPVPAGNQSPYPLQEAPHSRHGGPPKGAKVARTPEPHGASVPVVVAVAAGIGLAALAGGIFYALAGAAKPKKRAKRKAPRSSHAKA